MKTITLFFLMISLVCTSYATTYTVLNANASGAGSLLEAIDNANLNAGADNIEFNIPGMPPHSIPLAVTATVEISDEVVIDGSTQPDNGYTGNCPKIQIDAAATPTTVGVLLRIAAPNVSIFGMAFRNFSHLYSSAISVAATNAVIGQAGKKNTFNNVFYSIYTTADSLEVNSNYFGCNCDGDALDSNAGIAIIGTSALNNIIIKNNLISGNSDGIVLGSTAASCTNVVIQGNMIGTDITGTYALGNLYYGTDLRWVTGLVFGGSVSGEGNVVSGNGRYGSRFTGCSGSIKGNFIGTDISGNDTLPNDPMNTNYSTALNFNGSSGITSTMQVGGFNPGEENVIFGNNIGLNMADSSGFYQIYGNVIGQTLSGLVSPNQNLGIQLYYDTNQVIMSSNYVYGTSSAIYATQCRNFLASDNIIGYDINNNLLQLGTGINVSTGASFNIVNNIIQNCNTGIHYVDANDSYTGHNQIQDCQSAIYMWTQSTSCHYNQMDQNTLSNNMFAVDISNGQSYAANDDIMPPMILGSTPDSTWGSSLPDALIDLALDITLDPAHPQGFDYSIPRFSADASGHWVYLGALVNPNDYTAMQTDVNNNSSGFSSRLTLGINKSESKLLKLYPVPADDFLIIENSSLNQWEKWQIVNTLGAIVLEGNFSNSSFQKINIENLPEGFYLIKVNTANSVQALKWLKN